MACRDVEENEFVGSLSGVFGAKFDGVANVFDVDEVDAFDGLAVADVEAGYDSFC